MPIQYPNEVLPSVDSKYRRPTEPNLDDDHAEMTLSQASYLMTLCEEAGETMEASLTRAQAAKRIVALEDATGRGRGHQGGRL